MGLLDTIRGTTADATSDDAFDAEASCERADVSLLGGGGKHAASVAELADDGYELVTIG